MLYHIGLDIGGSTTKVVAFDGKDIIIQKMIANSEPQKCASEAIRFVTDTLGKEDEYLIHATGAGISFLNGDICGLRTIRISEFEAIARGGLFLSGLDKAVVACLGTGSAFVEAKGNDFRHIIGSGVGGGTIVGLTNLLGEGTGIEEIENSYDRELLSSVDLRIGDISNTEISSLTKDVTASNFGKAVGDISVPARLTGIVNLVAQSLGTLSVMVSRLCDIKDVVFIGQMTGFKSCIDVLSDFPAFYGTNFVFPENAAFGTAVGAALSGGER